MIKKKNLYSYELLSHFLPLWLLIHLLQISVRHPTMCCSINPWESPTQQHIRSLDEHIALLMSWKHCVHSNSFFSGSGETLQCPTMHPKPYTEYPHSRHDPGTAHGCRFAWWHKNVKSPCGCLAYIYWTGSNSSRTSSSTVNDGPVRKDFRRWKAIAYFFFWTSLS